MEKKQSHVLVVPFHSQGHINPMLDFAKSLSRKGLTVTIISTISDSSPMKSTMSQAQAGPDVKIEPIPFTLHEPSMTKYFELYQDFVIKFIHELVAKHAFIGDPIIGIVYDSFLPLIYTVGEELGLVCAPFFTQSCAVAAVLNEFRVQGEVQAGLEKTGLPVLGNGDLPSFVADTDSNPALLGLMLGQFANFDKSDWIFFNTVKSLEEEVVGWMETQWAIKTIGPTIPSSYMTKQSNKNEQNSDHEPNIEQSMNWLDKKQNGSVIYIAFGSLASLGPSAMTELASALQESENNFFWVIRNSEIEKLPSNFISETLEKGLVVSWCPQLDVLAHKAIGCFVTHCGWNSILEALSLGVPMVAMPQFADQPTNAKFIADVWKVGVRVKVEENGIVKREEIEMCIREVMEGEDIKRNAEKWKGLVQEATEDGGCSDKNIEEFVKYVLSQTS